MSRSCHSATFSSAAIALARTRRARPTICSQPIGLRLCGIADEPFWPLRERLFDLADLGLLQAANLRAANFSRRGGGDRQRRHEFGVAIALDDLRGDRRRCEAETPQTAASISGVEVRERADGARAACRPRSRRARRAARAMSRCSSAYHSASFTPSVIGSACTPCVRPIIGVRRCSWARSRTGRQQRGRGSRGSGRTPRASAAPAPVSTTSDEVRPKWSHRGRKARRCSATAVVNAITSCCVICSISSMRATSNSPRSRMSRAASAGTTPASRHRFRGGRFDQQPRFEPPRLHSRSRPMSGCV